MLILACHYCSTNFSLPIHCFVGFICFVTVLLILATVLHVLIFALLVFTFTISVLASSAKVQQSLSRLDIHAAFSEKMQIFLVFIYLFIFTKVSILFRNRFI